MASRFVALVVCLFLFCAAFGLVQRGVDIPQIRVEYPEPLPAPQELLAKLRPLFGDLLRVKVDPIGGQVVLLVSSPIRTGVAVNTRQDVQRAALVFAQRFPELFPTEPQKLCVERCEKIGRHWYVSLRQRAGGYDALGCTAELRINTRGEVFLFRSTLKPLRLQSLNVSLTDQDAISAALEYLGASQGDVLVCKLAVAAIPDADSYQGRLVWWLRLRTKEPLGLWCFWIDAGSGEILRATDEMPTLTGTITGQYKPNYIDEPSEEGVFPHLYLSVDGDPGYTDSTGSYDLGNPTGSHTFYTILHGRYCRIEDNDYPTSSHSTTVSGESFDFFWTTDHGRENQLNLYYHTNWIHNYVKYFLGFSGMDYAMPARVNDPYDPDNAYYDGEGINFGGGGTYFYDMAMFSDVIYHEYTHGVTHHIYPYDLLPYYGQSGALDEAFSDYFPCSIHDDQYMGEHCFREGPSLYMRNLSNSLRYPDDYVNEVHHDSQIISGAWWEIRRELGAGYTDSLVHLARFGYPNDFESFLYEMLAVDDDDGNLDNGTPNAGVIYTAYHRHGIGPDTLLAVDHTPLHDTEDTTGSYEVTARVVALLGIDSIALCYRVDWSPWECIEMTPVLNVWRSFIPAQPLGSYVHYYIYVEDNAGNYVTSPEGAPVNFHHFRVALDTIPPTVEHLPILRGCSTSWPPVVFAKIDDNGSVAEAYIEYRLNGVPQPNVSMSYDEERDGWVGRFECDVLPGDEISYCIHAVDNSHSANETVFPSSEVWITFPVVLGYFDDIESGGYDFTHQVVTPGFLDQWHLSTARTHSGTYSFKCGGSGTSDYDDQVDAALVTPPISVFWGDTLSFYHWAEIETSTAYSGYAWDGGVIEASTDGGLTWVQLSPIGGYPFRIRNNPESPFPAETPCLAGRRNWEEIRVPILFACDHAQFRFHFGSDGAVTYEGWYIDDVRVTTRSTAVLERFGWKPEKLAITAFPNPFNSALKLNLFVPSPGRIEVVARDVTGRVVARLFEGSVSAGILSLSWRPQKTLPGGMYVISLSGSGAKASTKVLLVK